MAVRRLSGRHNWRACKRLLPRAMRPKCCWKLWMRCCRVKHFFRRECVEKRAFSKSRDLLRGRLETETTNPIATTNTAVISRLRWKLAGNWSYRRGAGGGRGVRLLRDARIGVLPRRRGKKVLAARNRKWPYLRLVLFRLPRCFRDDAPRPQGSGQKNNNRKSRRIYRPRVVGQDWCPLPRSTH